MLHFVIYVFCNFCHSQQSWTFFSICFLFFNFFYFFLQGYLCISLIFNFNICIFFIFSIFFLISTSCFFLLFLLVAFFIGLFNARYFLIVACFAVLFLFCVLAKSLLCLIEFCYFGSGLKFSFGSIEFLLLHDFINFIRGHVGVIFDIIDKYRFCFCN